MSIASKGAPTAAEDCSKDTTAPPQAEVSEHPVLQHKLALIRHQEGTAKEFRALFREITFYLGERKFVMRMEAVLPILKHVSVFAKSGVTIENIARKEDKRTGRAEGYEATRDLTTRKISVKTDVVEKCPARKIAEKVAVVPILRGGLGMTEALLELLPESPVYHVGMYRNPGSNIPVQYYNRLPKGNPSDVALILDPIIASSRTITAVVSMVKKWGAKKIKVVTLVASRSGLEVLCKMHPEVQVYLASIDELAENGLDLVPGIGDAGDRLYLGAHVKDIDIDIAPSSDDCIDCDQPNAPI